MGLITRHISSKVAIVVNLVILVVIGAGTYFLVTQQRQRLEADLLERGKMQSIVGAKMVGKIFEEAIDNGVFSIREAFDTDYQQIGNFDPPKFHTKYDFYTDKAVLGIIDEFLLDESIVFAVPVDVNGYLPTHNTRYQQPITGDVDKDRVGNRTKRVFNDPVGLKAAQNKDLGFLQIYHRDTGKVMWDVSSPIYIKGKHWGGFRVGLSLDVIEREKNNLMQGLMIVMGVILVLSVVVTHIAVNFSLAPLKRLTAVAQDLADANNLEQSIPVTRKDEVGRLQAVLERLRLSMIIALKKRKG
ncbi:MAG: HAMP domain-containing protein [Desulfobacterales bacterium]|nr:HAMP domain-containing protein [Desulfobacterales bacterium]